MTTEEIEAAALRAQEVDAAANFLLAGGILTLADWNAMQDEQRALFRDAGVAIEKDRAEVLARAILRAQMDPAKALG